MQNHFRLKLLVSAIALAAATSVSATTTSNAFVPLAHAQHATLLRNGEVVTGPVASSQVMNVSVSLNLQNQDKLKAFLATAAKPGTPVAQRSMSSAAFLAQFSPTQAQAQAVAAYLTKAGFKNVTITPNRQLVTAAATADTVRAAFHTSFESAVTKDGHTGYHNTSDVQIPVSLKETVLAVVGLDTVHISHTFAQKKVAAPAGLPLGGSNTFLTTAPVAHLPTDFATIYGANTLAPATTVPVGIITEGSMANILLDLAKFTSDNHLSAVNTQVFSVDPTGDHTDVSGDVEWDLDSQDIVGMSGGVSKMVFYATTGLTDAAITDAYNAAVVDNQVPVINVSLGECETGPQMSGTALAEDQIFMQAVAQGQTFSVSSGDSGANECSPVQYLQGDDPSGIIPSWPASSQYVVSVGGTEVYTGIGKVADATTWKSEIVWNNKSEYEGAGGGSPSSFEAQPIWQLGVGANAGSALRGVPDIAFDGSPDSGATIVTGGKTPTTSQVGGTSLSSPLFVGAWARTIANNASAATPSSASGPMTLGFAAPMIYKLPTAAFHDITVGDNAGESATPGWDYASGFGSPIVSVMSDNVVAPMGATPVAAYTSAMSSDPSTQGLGVVFTDGSTDAGGAISTHYWDFGADGTSSYATNPSHTFAASGTYVVTETVTDSASGAFASVHTTVTVLSTTDAAEKKSPVPVPTPPPTPALPI